MAAGLAGYHWKTAHRNGSNSNAIKRLFQRAPEADTDKDGVLTLKEALAFLKAQGRSSRPTTANE